MNRFFQLEIDEAFKLPYGDPDATFKKISDTRAVLATDGEWGKAQYPFRKDTEVTPLNPRPSLSTWEEYTIQVTHEPNDTATEDERAEVTDDFESELYRLVKKYQGRAGLTFYARNSEDEIVEY